MNADVVTQAAALPQLLVVDDESSVFDVFQHILPASHYALTLATDGRQAVELAASRAFDLAFVDYFLAELNGAEVALQMREAQPSLKVILMSCYSEHENRDAMLKQAGASDWLTKPLMVAQTRTVTDRVLREKASAPPA